MASVVGPESSKAIPRARPPPPPPPPAPISVDEAAMKDRGVKVTKVTSDKRLSSLSSEPPEIEPISEISEISEIDDGQEDKTSTLINLITSPYWQYLMLVLLCSLYFIPFLPNIVSFVQGFLFTVFAVGVLFLMKFGKYLKLTKDEFRDRKTFSRPVVKIEELEYKPKKIATLKKAYMNIWPKNRGHYDMTTYDVKDTESVKLTLSDNKLWLQYPVEKLPTRQLWNESLPDDIPLKPEGDAIELKTSHVFLLPEGLPRKKWFKRKYPITIETRPRQLQGRSFYFYLFPRTDKDKENWFTWLYDHINKAKKYINLYEEGVFRRYMKDFFNIFTQKPYSQKLPVALVNKLIARVWFNLRVSRTFNHYMRQKLSKSLRRIKIAKYFSHVGIQELLFREQPPYFMKWRESYEDDYGLWLSFDIEYNGEAIATIRTQGLKMPAVEDERKRRKKKRGDDSGNSNGVWNSLVKDVVVNAIVGIPWVKKQMAARPVALHFQLKKFRGTVILNLPTPPADRLWYGFRKPPDIEVKIIPCVGDVCLLDESKKESLSHLEYGLLNTLVQAFEKKLKEEICKLWVHPNMGNLPLPFFKSPQWYGTNE